MEWMGDIWKVTKFKATSFHGLQRKAQKGHKDLRVQLTWPAHQIVKKPEKKKKKKKTKWQWRWEGVCLWCGPLDTAGVISFLKRLHVVHSQLSRRFRKLPDKDGLKPNAAAVTLAVVCVPQVIQSLPWAPSWPSPPSLPLHTPPTLPVP